MDSPRRVSIACVGAGYWGRNLVRVFANLPGSHLKMVCDSDAQVRKRIEAQHSGVTAVSDYESVLQDANIDAVVIAVPALQHYETAKLALESGKHVFVEKPMTTRVSEAEDLVEIAGRNGLTLMVGHLLVHHPAVDTLKSIVRTDENALWSLAPHDIAVILYLLDQDPDAVSARGESYLQRGIEDVVFVNLHFKDGKMAQLQVSWLDPHKIRKLTIVGSEKMVVFDDMESTEKIRIFDKAAERENYESYGEAITLRFGDVVIPHIHMDEPLKLECQHFVDCVGREVKSKSDGLDGLRVVRVLQAAQRSLEQGGIPVVLESSCE